MRPIELQDNLSKTQAAEKVNQIQKAHSEMEQRMAANALKEKSASGMEKPHEAEKMDMVIIHKDDEKEEEKKKNQEKKEEQEETEDQAGRKPDHLDLTA